MTTEKCCFTQECHDCKTVLVEKVKRVKVNSNGEPLFSELRKIFRSRIMKFPTCTHCGGEEIAPTYYFNEIFDTVSF